MSDKPTGTSAGSTAFCGTKLHFPDIPYFLWFDGNGKITAGNGTLDKPEPNAFSVVEITDCPGATPTCKQSCYVHGLRKHAPETHDLYRWNSAEIRRILNSEYNLKWATRVGAWIGAHCKGGFRWHVSGDIFSLAYSLWIASVIDASPHVDHWIYTRSFGPMTAPLLGLKNLSLNISCDRDNFAAASAYANEHDLRLCYMNSDGIVPAALRDGDVIFPDYAYRGGTEAGQQWFAELPPEMKKMVCPVDFHGKAENRRCGPCPRCLFPKGHEKWVR